MDLHFETKVKSEYSQAMFATEEEIIKKFPSVNHKDTKSKRGGGLVVISDGENSVIEESDNSTVTIGSTGSKKTRNVVMPHVESCARAGKSMVIHDPKADIYKTMVNRLRKMGYKIVVLDIRDPEYGERYNPLEKPAELYQEGEKDRAREMFKYFADTIFSAVKSDKDPFWHMTSAAYFAGLAELLCIEFPAKEVTIDNIYSLHLQGEAKFGGSTYLKSYFDKKKSERCWKLIYPVATAPNDTRNSINAVFTSGISTFIQNDAVVDQTTNSTFKVEDMVKEKTVVFIISRDEGSVYDALITAIIDQFYTILTDLAEKSGGCLKRKVSFILDEFGNLTEITDIQKKISLSRARGITWHIVCQSLDQLSLVYGEKKALIILGNCNNIVYLYSPDIKLVKYISDLCGERAGETISDIKMPLCPVNMLRHLDKDSGECLMLLDRMNPFVTKLPDISQYYGIEPIEKVDVKKRKRQELKSVDFTRIVEQMKKAELDKMMAETERMHEEMRRKEREEKQKLRTADPNNIISVIDNVLFCMSRRKA
jgi:type IV secretion system protein VirD4